MLLQAPGWFLAAEEEGSPISLDSSSAPLSVPQIIRPELSSHPESTGGKAFGSWSWPISRAHLDANCFFLRPLERSPGSGHYLSAHWTPRSSKPRVLAAS